MTGPSGHPIDTFVATAPAPRLSLKPVKSTSGYVDGAWWPGSLDLVAEIPALVAQLSDRWGAVDRVSYDLAAWAPAARRVSSDGRRIRLDGFSGRRPTDAVHVMGGGRPALTLLVIPPTSGSREAAETLRRAGSSDNQETIDDLLHLGQDSDQPKSDRPTSRIVAGVDTHTRIHGGDAADLGRWDTEGGHDHRRAG